RGSLGPLADGRINAVNTPRYARIHASVRFRLRRPQLAPAATRASRTQDKSNSAQAVCLRNRLFPVTVKNGLRNRRFGAESLRVNLIPNLKGRKPRSEPVFPSVRIENPALLSPQSVARMEPTGRAFARPMTGSAQSGTGLSAV